MPRKTRANRVPSTPSVSPSRVQLFRNERSRETYEKLNSKRKIWAERSMILDEVDPAIALILHLEAKYAKMDYKNEIYAEKHQR